VIVALYPAATLWNSGQQASANAASLTATGLPLLAAELPGYRITQAATVLRAAEDLVPRGASDFPSGP